MKARIRHFWEILAGAILSLLGFSGCSLMEIFVPKAEYGMPHADYKLVGTVETETGAPVEGIKVTYSRKEGTYQDEQGNMVDHWYRYETFSDAEGKVSAQVGDYREEARDIMVALEDVDGEKNGAFEPLVLEGNDLDITFEKDAKSAWHVGSYTVSFQARLREKGLVNTTMEQQ